MESIIKDLSESIEASKKVAFTEPQRAFKMAEEALQKAQKYQLEMEEAAALFAMALACRSMTDLNGCYNYVTDAYRIYEKVNYEAGLSMTLNLFGVVYFYYANYERATEYFLKALHYANKVDDQMLVSRVYNNIGEVYRESGDYEEAISAYEHALEISESCGLVGNIPVILENLGDIYLKRETYDTAYDYFRRSFDLLINQKNGTALSEVETKLGRIHFIREEYTQAKICYDNALERLEKMGNKYFAVEVLINLAEYELKFGNEKLFVSYLNQGEEYGEALHAVKKLSQIYKLLTDYYERKCSFDLALNYYKRYHHMEQAVETTIVSQRLAIIKIEINKTLEGQEIEEMKMLNHQLEREIEMQSELLKRLEEANVNLNKEILLDELTQISSRRGVKQYLQHLFDSNEKNCKMVLMMLDIDHFKHYNDTHGHIEGDKCLQKIAARLKQVMDDHKGVLGRYGGEEFVCGVKDLSLQEAQELAELIRKSVENIKMSYEWQGEKRCVTISIGCVYGDVSRMGSMQQMYILADEQLYCAKNEGRNCVRFNVL